METRCDLSLTTSSEMDSDRSKNSRSNRTQKNNKNNVWREVSRHDCNNSFQTNRKPTELHFDWPVRRRSKDQQQQGRLATLKQIVEQQLSRRIATLDPDIIERRRKSEFELRHVDDEDREILFTDVVDASGDLTQDALNDEPKVTVPISICLIIIAVYIFAGSLLFYTVWEDWDYITGSYFCFITLSTIGFGDIVPGTDMKEGAAHRKLILCSMWLVVGLSPAGDVLQSHAGRGEGKVYMAGQETWVVEGRQVLTEVTLNCKLYQCCMF